MKEDDRRRQIKHGRQDDGMGAWARAFFAGLFALAVSAGIGLALLLALSLAAYTSADPDSLTLPLGLGALVITSVMCGFIAARRGGRAAALCGLVAGGLLTLLLLAASLCFGDGAKKTMGLGTSGGVSALLHAGVVALSTVGAIISETLKRRKESKPRHTKNYFEK